MMSTTIRLAEPDDLAAAAEALVAAFDDYPWTRHVIPEEGYHDRLRTLQRVYLEHAQRHGIVAVDGSASGVIALLPPDAPQPSPEVIEQVVALHGDRIDRLTQTDGVPGAWRLETLGVRPDSQGAGIGGRLLRSALDEAGRRGATAVVLETSDPSNVRLYERHGFITIAHQPGSDAPPVWTMHAAAPAGSSPEPARRVASPEPRSPGEALLAYLIATNSHDFDRVERLLNPDAVYFFGDATRVGGAAVRDYFERTWAAIPDERYWAEGIAWITSGDQAAVATYTYRWSGTIDGVHGGGAGRATNVFVAAEGGWRLVHEHLSSLPSA